MFLDTEEMKRILIKLPTLLDWFIVLYNMSLDIQMKAGNRCNGLSFMNLSAKLR